MTDDQVRVWLAELDKRYSWRGWWELRRHVVEAEWTLEFRPLDWAWPVLSDDRVI